MSNFSIELPRKKIYYFDNNATTNVDPEVFNVMKPFFTKIYFNPSSAYDLASIAKNAITQSRLIISDFLSCNEHEILFTGCASESNNAAINSALKIHKNRRHIITTRVEHPAILEVAREYEENEGYEVTYLKVNNRGEVDLEDFRNSIREDTAIISIMHANNETGVIFPIDKLSKIAKEVNPKVLFHTDATQSVGKINIDLSKEFKYVDMLSFSGHKLHAPKGVGALFIRENVEFHPLLIGGHQEEGHRAGTENVAFIVALGKACEIAKKHFADEAKVEALRDKLENTLLEEIPCIRVNGRGSNRLYNTTNISFEYIEGEAILYQLAAKNICASSGSACTSGSLEPSHVLLSMNVPIIAAHGSIRFSLSRFNTEKEVDYLIKTVPKIIKNLRRLSPFWDSKNNKPKL